MSILINTLTFILVLVSAFLVLMVLMQKAKSDGAIGSGMGGGMAEATFGAETGNVLSKATINASIIFFVLAFGLYLGHKYQQTAKKAAEANALPAITAPAVPATPATPPASSAMPAIPVPPAPGVTPAPEAAK